MNAQIKPIGLARRIAVVDTLNEMPMISQSSRSPDNNREKASMVADVSVSKAQADISRSTELYAITDHRTWVTWVLEKPSGVSQFAA